MTPVCVQSVHCTVQHTVHMTSAGGGEYHRTISDITMVTCHVSRHDLPVQEVGQRVADGKGEEAAGHLVTK